MVRPVRDMTEREFRSYIRFRQRAAGMNPLNPIEHHPRFGYTVFSQEIHYGQSWAMEVAEALA